MRSTANGSFTYEWREPHLLITSAPSYFSCDFRSGGQLCDSTTQKGTFLTGCAFLMRKHCMLWSGKSGGFNRVVPNANRGIKERIKCASTAEIRTQCCCVRAGHASCCAISAASECGITLPSKRSLSHYGKRRHRH